MPDEGFTELAGPRVALRRFHPGDVAGFVAYRSSAQVARFQSWDAPYPREEGERFVREPAKEHPAATRGMRRRWRCWNGWGCGGKVTCAGAPGLRANGPATLCMPCCVMSGSPGENEFTRPYLPQAGLRAGSPWPRLSRLWRFRGSALCLFSQAASAATPPIRFCRE
jgi:hypothetical protein